MAKIVVDFQELPSIYSEAKKARFREIYDQKFNEFAGRMRSKYRKPVDQEQPAVPDQVEKTFNPSQPRGANGTWIDSKILDLAKTDTRVADAIRASLMDPLELEKFEAYIASPSKGKGGSSVPVAKTVVEAAKVAEKLGLAKKAEYKKISVEYANEVNRVLFDLKQKYGQTFDEIKTTMRKTRESASSMMMTVTKFDREGAYDKTELVVNGGTNAFIKENLDAVNKYHGTNITKDDNEFDTISKFCAGGKKYSLCTDIERMVIHEFGHLITTSKDCEKAKRDRDTLRYLGDFSLSPYAGTHGIEALAETFVLFNTDPGALTDRQIQKFNQYSEVKISRE